MAADTATPVPTVRPPEGHTVAPALPSGLSPSSLNSYRQCQVRWAYEKVVRLPTIGSIATIAGTHVHRVLELTMALPGPYRTLPVALAHHRATLLTVLAATRSYVGHDGPLTPVAPGQVDTGRATDLLGSAADDNHSLSTVVEILEVAPDLDELVERTDAGVRAYFAMSADPAAIDVEGLELPLNIRLDTAAGTVPVRGIIDRLDRLPDTTLMPVDYKTGRSPDPRYDDGSYRNQLLFYAVMLRATLGETPTVGALLYLGDQQVKTYRFGDVDLDAFEAELGQTWADINVRFDRGLNYRPTVGPLCGWCPFVALCPDGADEVRRRDRANGTGRGGVRADAPARELLGLRAAG